MDLRHHRRGGVATGRDRRVWGVVLLGFPTVTGDRRPRRAWGRSSRDPHARGRPGTPSGSDWNRNRLCPCGCGHAGCALAPVQGQSLRSVDVRGSSRIPWNRRLPGELSAGAPCDTRRSHHRFARRVVPARLCATLSFAGSPVRRCTMRTGSLAGLAIATVTAALTATVAAQNTQPQPTVDFVRDIQPILQASCYECHGSQKTKAHLRLDSPTGILKGGETGSIVVPGKSEQSLIVRRILGLDGDDRMPKDGDPLPPAHLALIRSWIDQGAKWPGGEAVAATQDSAPQEAVHWAYRRPARPALPEVRNSQWVKTPIDRFVLARLEKEALSPSAEAPLEVLVRRVSLDLVGLPPSPAEVDAVVAEAERNGKDAAYASLVERLLASPHYGERWARPWLDLARYADSQGFEKDLPRVMWKYRDWVIDALNRDMPFDRFTVEQIAGDMLPDATPDQLVASGFHRNAMTNEEGGIDPEEAMYEVLVDRVNTTASAWLGTTLACAQCHDNKY